MLTLDSIQRKSLLYKSGVEYADYCLNHVEGCSHGCRYPCYAYLMKKRCGVIHTYEEWCRPRIVANSLELLEREIPRLKSRINFVHMCFSTDPFMFNQSEIIELSLKILRKLNESYIPVTTLTKGIIPSEIADMKQIGRSMNEYGVSLVSMDENFREYYEPHSAPNYRRIQALEHLHSQGFKTYVSIEPYPTPNIINQDIYEVLEAIRFADKIIFGRMNYNRKVTEYKDYQEYYREMTYLVTDFCRRNNIEWHIKQGTIR